MNTISSYLSSINWYSQIQSLSGNILGQQVSCSQNQQTGDSVQISSQGLALNKFSQSSFLDKISSILDNLVSDGTISEDQESAVLTALETARTESEQKTEAAGQADDPLAGLVADGTITSEQQAAIKSAFEAMGPPPPPPEMNSANSQSLDPLDSLVSDGTITSEQQDAIKKAFESSIALLQNGSGNTTSIDPLDSLVSNGTITEEQKNEVKEALQSSRPAPPPKPPTEDDDAENLLDSLVENGTITEDQETAIIKAFEEAIKSYNLSMNYSLV